MVSLGKEVYCGSLKVRDNLSVDGRVTARSKLIGEANNLGELQHNGSVFYIKWSATHQAASLATTAASYAARRRSTAPVVCVRERARHVAAHTHARARTHTRARTHARTHTHTQRKLRGTATGERAQHPAGREPEARAGSGGEWAPRTRHRDRFALDNSKARVR